MIQGLDASTNKDKETRNVLVGVWGGSFSNNLVLILGASLVDPLAADLPR